MKILYLSFFPENNNKHEIENLKSFINSTKYYHLESIFTYRLFSCYDDKVNELKTIFNCPISSDESLFNFNDYRMKIERLYFDFKENMIDINLHENAWVKQKIFLFMTFDKVIKSFDFICYNDSFIRLDSNDIYESCKILDRLDDYFINIPSIASENTYSIFNSYIIPTSFLSLISPIEKFIYNPIIKNNKSYIETIPENIIKKSLLNQGYSELIGNSCNTKSYINNENYYEYEAGKGILK